MTEINKKYTSKIKFFKVQGKIYLLSVGKAATSMTEGLLELCESEIEKGYMVIPYGYNFSHTKITVFNSGHPVPDENGEFAAKTMSFNTMLLTTYLEGEAKEVTHALSSIVKEIKTQAIQLIYLGNYCWWRDNC